MSSVLPTDQWSVREKLCLASSVIRSGDQNWVSVSRAIKPFSEPGRPPDWFSQKNCACQYSALLEAVDTPKRKRSERGEVVDTPGDLIVRKMTRERVAELNVRLEEDRVRYRQLQREIEQIRSGQLDDRLPVMLDDIQDQKRAAEEAEEARRLAALAKATVAVKPSSKIPFQSPNKRRPQAKHPRPVSVATHLSTAEMSSVQAERVDVEDASPTAGPDAARSSEEGGTIAEPPDLLISTEFDKELDATVEDVIAEDSDETVERLLAATANDLVELLSPYPVDSLTLPGPVAANPTPTPAPRQEPLILKIEKGVLKTKEPKVETSTPKPKTDVEVTGGKELDSEALVTSTPQDNSGGNKTQIAASRDNSKTKPLLAETTEGPKETSNGGSAKTTASTKATDALGETTLHPKQPPNPKQPNTGSPTEKCLSPENLNTVKNKNFDEALQTKASPPVQGLQSLQECTETKLLFKSPSRQSADRADDNVEMKNTETAVKPDGQSTQHQKETSPPKSQTTRYEDSLPATAALCLTGSGNLPLKPPATQGAPGAPLPVVTGKPVKILEDVAKSSGDPDDDKPHPPIKPPSPRDSSLQDDSDQKIKKKYPGRGRPPGSQRKHHRGRPPAVTQQEDNDDQRRATSSPPGRRTAGKDVLVTTGLSSLTDDGKEDTHSEAEDSDITDKHGESDRDDLSAGAMQSSSFFMDSLPNSPASVSHSEEDHAYKILRKAIMLVWRAIASHKYANVFLHPVTEDIAPGYNSIVLRPMNLMTIKKNVENGVTRTTDQFHRDMMLMFQNAIMYNNADQHVHQIANTMQADVIKQIEEEERTRRSSTETDTSGKKRRTRSDE